MNKIEITYLQVNKEKDRLNKISEILSEGVYKYLKEKGLLKENLEQKVKIKKLLDGLKNVKIESISKIDNY
ncbi:unnamed protein product [marine sediment metagenome]|uniref:Uncharacterized protein n=1 Tax=marine sediment metagenome TaxID=412755 RepID=X1B6T1_9ZZZZ